MAIIKRFLCRALAALDPVTSNRAKIETYDPKQRALPGLCFTRGEICDLLNKKLSLSTAKL